MSLALISLILSSSSSLVPSQLRCEYLNDPIGIDEAAPRLSWIDSSSRRNATQSAYRVVVASTAAKLAKGQFDLWDSGRVESSESCQIEYAGKPLAPGQSAFWKVAVFDEANHQTFSSASASWELGLPSQNDWHAKWISIPNTTDEELKNPAPMLRKEFAADEPIAKARVYASAKGLYRLYIDGKPVGNQLLTPGWTDYRKRIDYQTYDVTHLLKKGPNAIGIVLGHGWYSGRVGFSGGSGFYGTTPEGVVHLSIDYRDGSHTEVNSDSSWQGSTGPILSNDLLMGETYDARKDVQGWSEPGFASTTWQKVDAHDLDVPLVAQPSPPVQVITEIKPVKFIPQAKPGVFVLDLGQNMVGWAKLRVQGAAGDTVQMRFAEVLNPDKTIYTTNLRGARATDSYTLKGSGLETYQPTFTAHGFRYVELTGFPGTPTLSSITGEVVGSNNPKVGSFACSNPLVNTLQHNIYWGERGNYLSIPTDCPQRDERLGWMGDAQIFVRTACYNNDIAGFMTKWTQDVEDAQSEQGGFSDVSPRLVDLSDGAPAWGDAGVIVPYTIYACYGDKRLLAKRYESMKKWIEYIDSANPDHTWSHRGNNNFGDWLNVNDDTPRPVIGTAYFAYSTELVRRSAVALGETADAAKYGKLEQQIKEAFYQRFVAPDGKIEGDSQTDYVLALRFHLIPEALRDVAAKRLVDHILIDRKGHLSTGFVGVGYLNPTLTEIGRTDVAYKLLTNDTYPSWGYSIRQGATTIWERWDGYTQEKGFQDPGMNSFNHYSLGSVGEWMYRTVGGIDTDPAAPGYKRIVIHPIPGGGITWAKASVDTIRGKISSSWKLNGGRFSLDITIPSNTTADVWIPTSQVDSVQEHGIRVSPSKTENGFEIVKVGGGKFHFTSKL